MKFHLRVPIHGSRALALLLVSTFVLSGCGYYYNWQLGKKNTEVEGLLGQARSQEADRYLPDEFKRADQAFNDSRNAGDGGNFDEAFAKSDEAKSLAEQILSRLASVKMAIQEKQADLTDTQNQLTAALGQIRALAPEEASLIDSASRAIGNASTVMQAQVQVLEGEQGYEATLQAARAALQEATTGLARIQKNSAEKLVQQLDQSWQQAQNLEITRYVPDSSRIPEEIQHARDLIGQASYVAVLKQGQSIEQDLKRQIDTTKELRAKARVQHAERLISLAEGESSAALDKINEAKSKLEEAAGKIRDGQFDEAFLRAEDAISSVRAEVKTYEEDLKQQLTDLTARIDESSKWKTGELSAEAYKKAVADQDQARIQINEFLFKDAQEAIDHGQSSIEEAIAMAREIGLAVRNREAESNLLATEEKGTYIYLPEQYQAIQGLISDATSQVDSGEFDQAEATLDKAEKQTIELDANMRKLAEQRLAEVDAAVREAADAGAEKHAVDVLADARTVLAEGQSQAAKGVWKEALAAAGKALPKAVEAARQAYRAQTESLTPAAQKEIQNARDAGAAQYAAAVLNKALDALDQSQKAFQSTDFKTALAKATEARDEAVLARKHQVDKAQEAADSAIAALAQDFDKETIAAALLDLTASKEKMDQGQYEESRTLAVSAEEKAHAAETRTWNTRAASGIATLKERVAKSDQSFAATYATDEFKRVSQTLAEAEALFASSQFKEAFQKTETGAGEADQVFARLEDQAAAVRKDYDTQVNQLKTFVMDDFGLKLHQESTVRLGAIDEAIQRKDLPQVFSLYQEGMTRIQKASAATKLHNINTQKEKLLAQVNTAEQNGLFRVVPFTAESLRADIGKVDFDPQLDRLKPDADLYREAARGLAKVESDMSKIRETAIAAADTRIQKIRTDIDNARQIGARDLTATAFDGAVDSYEKARDMLALLRNPVEGTPQVNVNQLADQIASAESVASQLNTAAVNQRNSVDFLRDLIVWTYDMTRFLDDWYPIEQLGQQMIRTAASDSRVDAYREFQIDIDARRLLTESERLAERVRIVNPPAEMQSLHQLALLSFNKFVEAADGFYRYGLYSRYPERLRDRYLSHAFASLERLHGMNETLLIAIMKKVKAFGLVEIERDLSNELATFTTYLQRDKTAG